MNTYTEEMNKKQNRNRDIGYGILLCLLLVLWAVASLTSNQSSSAIPIPLNFIGEYSFDGENWQPYSENAKINALDGDLILRGHFDFDLVEEQTTHFYLDHIDMTILVNGEKVASTIMPEEYGEQLPCASWWWTFGGTAITSADEMEIILSNRHSAGNPRAYQDCLENLYAGAAEVFSTQVLKTGQPWRVAGFTVIILSVLLLGVALADSLQSNIIAPRLWALGFFAMFSGGCMVLDTMDVVLWSSRVAFNTYGSQICRILAMLALTLCVAVVLKERRQKVTYWAAGICAGMDGVIAVLCLTKTIEICNTATVWMAVQVLLCLTLLACCVLEYYHAANRRRRLMLLSFMGLLAAILLELCNSLVGWWSRGLLVNIVFLLTFSVYLVWVAKGWRNNMDFLYRYED